MKIFLNREGISWDENFEPIIETGMDKGETISVNVTGDNFVIYNMVQKAKLKVIYPLSGGSDEQKACKVLEDAMSNYSLLNVLVTKSGMFMIYSDDEKFVLDLSKEWIEYKLHYKCEKEGEIALRNAILNREREIKENPNLANEINEKYEKVIEAAKVIVEQAKDVRLSSRLSAAQKYVKSLVQTNKR